MPIPVHLQMLKWRHMRAAFSEWMGDIRHGDYTWDKFNAALREHFGESPSYQHLKGQFEDGYGTLVHMEGDWVHNGFRASASQGKIPLLAWKKLSPMEQIAVAERMRRRYGGPFAQQFLDEVKKGKPQRELRTYQPGSGPKPDQLIASGYRWAGWEFTGNAGFEIEVWVHPSGRRIRRDVSTWKFGAAEPEKKPKTAVKKPPTVGPPPVKPPPVDDKQFEAMELLADLQLRNNELQELCTSDPFQLEDAEDAQINWTFARTKLRDLKDVDMRAVYPDFWKEGAAATAENAALRVKCCKRDPSNYYLSCSDKLRSE